MAAGVQHRASPRSVGDEDASGGLQALTPELRRDSGGSGLRGTRDPALLAHGKISFHGHGIYISGALAGWDVGLGDQHGNGSSCGSPTCCWATWNAGNDEL